MCLPLVIPSVNRLVHAQDTLFQPFSGQRNGVQLVKMRFDSIMYQLDSDLTCLLAIRMPPHTISHYEETGKPRWMDEPTRAIQDKRCILVGTIPPRYSRIGSAGGQKVAGFSQTRGSPYDERCIRVANSVLPIILMRKGSSRS